MTVMSTACGPSTPSSPAPSPPASSTTLTSVPSTGDWPASTPDAEGLDATILGELVGRIRSGTYGNIDSLLVVRHEKLVVEEYFGGRSASDVHTLQSVSKSVTSLLTGLAIERGRLRLDDRVVERFPQYAPIANMDDRKPRLTVRDLRHGGTRRNTEEHGLTRIRMTRTR